MTFDPTFRAVVVANQWNPTDLHVVLQGADATTWSLRGAPTFIGADDAWAWAAYGCRVLLRWHRMRAARDRGQWLNAWGVA